MIPYYLFTDDDDDDDKKRKMERFIKDYKYDNKPIPKRLAKTILESHSTSKETSETIKKKLKPVNRESANILSGKQFVFLGIGLLILLLYVTGNLNIENIELTMPEIKLFEPEPDNVRIKKEIDYLTSTQGKMDWVNEIKTYDNPEGAMKTLNERQSRIDKMDCNELANYVDVNTRATLRAYSAHLFIEKHCEINFAVSSIPDSAVITEVKP